MHICSQVCSRLKTFHFNVLLMFTLYRYVFVCYRVIVAMTHIIINTHEPIIQHAILPDTPGNMSTFSKLLISMVYYFREMHIETSAVSGKSM